MAGQNPGDVEYGMFWHFGTNNPGDVEYGLFWFIGEEEAPPPPPFERVGKEVLNVKIPRDKYWITDYPNLNPNADGQIIPDLFGEKKNITPVCIDTVALKYKIANCDIRAIFSIDKIRDGVRVLVSGVDYELDLPNGEFTIKGTPKLQPNTTYYYVLEGDWVINGTDRIQFYGWNNAYADGNAFEIDGGGVWTPITNDMTFVVYGKNTIDGEEEEKVWFTEGASYAPVKLRDHADRTKIAMSFKTPNDGQSFYVTKIIGGGNKNAGFPGGTVYMTLYSDQGITQVGLKSNAHTHFTEANNNIRFNFPQRGNISELLVDAKGYVNVDTSLMNNGSDILKYILNYRIGVSDSALDLAAFASYKTARTQPLSIYMDSEIMFNQFIETLEATHFFKFMPTLESKFAPLYYVAGEPGGTPHLQKEDFLPGFSCSRLLESVKQKYQILYGRNPTTNEYLTREVESDIAKFFYRNEETLQVSTYLKDAADAVGLANSYKALLEYPGRWAHFPARNYGLDQIPTEKVKITRARGDNSGGSFDAVLFRIMKLNKAISDGVMTFDTQLDTQTYE